MKNKPERWIAISVVLCALALMISLGLVLGRWHLPNSQRQLLVDFKTVSGINLNSPVKYAGAQVGRVHRVKVLSRKDEVTVGPAVYCIQVQLEIDPTLELGDDVHVAIKQDGLLGSRFIAIIPGRTDSQPLNNDKVLMGENPIELDDLLPIAQNLVASLQPTLEHLNSISAKMDEQLPELMGSLETLLNGGTSLLSSVNTPEGKAALAKTLGNLMVISDNLKVVTTQAKGITATLGEKPWRLLWGGTPTRLPSEADILKANHPLPVSTTEPSVH